MPIVPDCLLTLSFPLAKTTDNPPLGNWLGGVTVSRYAVIAGDPLTLTLTAVGDGDVFPGKKTLKLIAKARVTVE